MAEHATTDGARLRTYPPPPKGFDPFAATRTDLQRHGLPFRPDPHAQPGLAALWARTARRCRGFEHLETRPERTTVRARTVAPAALGPDPIESCGYSLTSVSAPFTALFVTWTVPNLRFSASPLGVNRFHTFVSLGFLDVHVQMTVDAANTVTSTITAQDVASINLPVEPGDVLSASLCLDTTPAGTAHYFLTNLTRGQTTSFTVDTGFPPAVTVSAGVTRDGLNQPVHPLARFGVVYFDEISAYTTSGSRSLTSGDAITMVEQNGTTLATPSRLTDFTFTTTFVAA